MENISTKEYLQNYSVRKDGLKVNKAENEKISTKDYLVSQQIHPIVALKVEEIKQDIVKKKIHNVLRILSTLLLLVSVSPWSNDLKLSENVKNVLAIGLLTDLCGIQIIKKS